LPLEKTALSVGVWQNFELVDERLVAAIQSPAIRTDATELVRLALFALADLRKLDDTLYGRFVASRQSTLAPAEVAAGLRTVWGDTFHALEHLLAHCRSLTKNQRAPSQPAAGADDIDFGDFTAAEEPSFDLGLGDIGSLVEGLDHQPQRESETKRWQEALEKISGIQYGLSSQYRDANERLEVAMNAGQHANVLGLLDDTTSSANEGLHALVAAVYEAFLPEVDRSGLVPEYLTTLARALRVRRGISQLSAALAPHNEALQSEDSIGHETALDAIRDLVRSFVASDVWRAMRAADRWELAQFDEQLREQPIRLARLTAEGLVKYLESLGAINQREVLVRHDQRIIDDLRETITSARELMDLSPTTTHEILLKACKSSLELRGRNPMLDALLEQNAKISSDTSSPSQNPALVKRLEDVVATAG
jgi:hypothetical protein